MYNRSKKTQRARPNERTLQGAILVRKLFQSRLFCNFFCKIFFSLLDSFSRFETNETFDGECGILRLCNLIQILLHGLLSVRSLDIDLLIQAHFLQFLVQTSD